ncbi:MAG: DUF302 domain-containing protein [Thiotrichaceae bacterium]
MSRMLTILISLILGAVIATVVGMKVLPGMMIKEIPSSLGFEETLEKVRAKAKEMGWRGSEKWTVDFQKNLMKVEKADVGPVTVLKRCETKAAVSILEHDELKKLSVMMPCSIAIYTKSDGKTYVAIMNMGILGSLFGDVVRDLTDVLGPQMETMANVGAAAPAAAQ